MKRRETTRRKRRGLIVNNAWSKDKCSVIRPLRQAQDDVGLLEISTDGIFSIAYVYSKKNREE